MFIVDLVEVEYMGKYCCYVSNVVGFSEGFISVIVFGKDFLIDKYLNIFFIF